MVLFRRQTELSLFFEFWCPGTHADDLRTKFRVVWSLRSPTCRTGNNGRYLRPDLTLRNPRCVPLLASRVSLGAVRGPHRLLSE